MPEFFDHEATEREDTALIVPIGNGWQFWLDSPSRSGFVSLFRLIRHGELCQDQACAGQEKATGLSKVRLAIRAGGRMVFGRVGRAAGERDIPSVEEAD